MKKLLLTLIVGFTCLPVAFAQVTLLPKVGFNVANVRFDDGDFRRILPPMSINTRARAGFVMGLGANLPIDKLWSVQTELLYISKGFAADDRNIEGQYSLNYLEIPLLIKATFGNRELSFYGNGGLSLGYLLGGRVKGGWNDDDDYNEKIDFEDNSLVLNEVDANRIDIGLNLGGGISFEAGGFPMFVDLRYNAGLVDYDQEAEPSKNRSFALTFGTKLPL